MPDDLANLPAVWMVIDTDVVPGRLIKTDGRRSHVMYTGVGDYEVCKGVVRDCAAASVFAEDKWGEAKRKAGEQ